MGQKHPTAQGSGSSRPRKQTPPMQARGKEDEQKQHTQPSAGVSPARRLHRHALESIFGILDLGDLSRILAVSRDWAAAVKSMAPIHASIENYRAGSVHAGPAWRSFTPFESIVGSPLLRHVAAIQLSDVHGCWTPFDNASLALLAQHAPHLSSLWCNLALQPNLPLMLPAKLQSLQLQLDHGYSDREINDVLTAFSALPLLSRLWFRTSSLLVENSTVELSRLAAAPSLTDLTIEGHEESAPTLSDAQVEQIRSSFGTLQRISVVWMDSNMLTRLLQPPVTARWRDIGFVEADAHTGEMLLTLPSLTTLDLTYRENTEHVDFLPQMPLLSTLGLYCHRYDEEWTISADALLASLARCNGITELSLRSEFNSAHWSALFAKLTKITKLTIRRGELDSLDCFADGSITQSLEELIIEQQDFLPSDYAPLYALGRLRTLDLNVGFDSLDDDTIQSFSPPTPRMPALTKWIHRGRTRNDKKNDSPRPVRGRTAFDKTYCVERQGPSFEWMQARLTQ